MTDYIVRDGATILLDTSSFGEAFSAFDEAVASTPSPTLLLSAVTPCGCVYRASRATWAPGTSGPKLWSGVDRCVTHLGLWSGVDSLVFHK